MPHVTTHYRVYVAEGHHRQPRNGVTWIEPNPQSDAEVVAGTTITPYAPPQLAYLSNGKAQVATFLFWSATDGTDGQTTTSQTLHQTVANTPMTLTAWYLPPGGIGNGGGTGYIVDAFSDALGDFVDDTFVTVVGDPALTTEANVVGIVSTSTAHELIANGSVHTGESFEQWIGGSPSGDHDTLAAGTSGVAIATYHRHQIQLPNGQVPREGVVILYGVIQDGGGAIIHLGGRGGPVPVGPWGPFMERAFRAATVGSLSHGMRGGAEVARIAAADAMDAVKQLGAAIEQNQ
ncbi:MAG: hypothetical protein QOI69_2788 [Pseudonocardiales bacterium]|jgi:hypothetical protein|nr:hypothetical protein [Pseudonocardiales bacterium]